MFLKHIIHMTNGQVVLQDVSWEDQLVITSSPKRLNIKDSLVYIRLGTSFRIM
jgi:hypothetical protein